MRILRLGDPHVRSNNIEESHALMNFVLGKAQEFKIDRLEILGDLFDTMSVIRLSVLEFWDRWFDTLRDFDFETIVLVGNHDIDGNYSSSYSALHTFITPCRPNFKIITLGEQLGIYGYLPYIHDNKKFVEYANDMANRGVKVLVSHTTYQGSKFDNGMYAPDGVDPDLLDPRLTHLITGHIHSFQEFGRVWYPGTARWLSKSDANTDKGIYLCDHNDETGALDLEDRIFIPTHSVCTKIVSVTWNEGQDKPEVPENADVNIELVGSSDWVAKIKKELVGVRVSSKITDTKKSKSRKSGKSLHEFLNSHYQHEKKEQLVSYMERMKLFE